MLGDFVQSPTLSDPQESQRPCMIINDPQCSMGELLQTRCVARI